jgi:hydroxyacylglutathione hydrolase
VILKQYYLGCLSHASYMVGDANGGRVAVIDPQRDIDQYLKDAESLGVRITDVFLTHFHADFVSGHLELRERTGARIRLGAKGEAEYPFDAMHDGDRVDLGRVRLSVLETPGHTPESISIVLHDLDRADGAPHAVFTGDTLFIGDVGRPDLMASQGVTAEQLAGMLYDSLRTRLMPLPDQTLVYPAHGAGSACGRNLSTETVSTIGDQKKLNYALRPMGRDEFIRLVVADQPPAPAYFSWAASANRREHPTLGPTVESSLRALPLAEVLRLRAGGAQLLDTRAAEEFALGHLAGSINIGLEGRYAHWAGSVLDRTRPIVLVSVPGSEAEAATRLGRIGFDSVAGFLSGGPATLGASPAEVRRIERLNSPDLAARLAAAAPPLVLDVRNPAEREQSRIAPSAHIPLGELPRRLDELPRGRPIVIHCASGYRSMIAASLLRGAGLEDVADLRGGIAAWQHRSA